MTEDIIISGTGHRPPRLGLDYSAKSNALLTAFAELALSRVRLHLGLENKRVIGVVSGMAQGWDQALAHAALNLKLGLICAVPFDEQESKWPAEARRRYKAILARAAEVTVVCPGPYAPWKFIRRDEWMVDNSHYLLALWDEEKEGGTWHTVRYARSKGKTVYNVWSNWSQSNYGVFSFGQPTEGEGHEPGAPSVVSPTR